MTILTFEDAYRAFVDMHGIAMPVRAREDLRHVLSSAELLDLVGCCHATEDHLSALFDCMWAWDSEVPDDLAAAALRRRAASQAGV